MPYKVNGGKRPKMQLLFDLFSGASTGNLRSLKTIYLKFAEYVDIFVQIIYAKFSKFKKCSL